MVRQLTHFVGGKHIEGTSGRFGDVFAPNTGEVQARVPLASTAEVQAVIANAAEAQKEWAAWNPQRRARVLMRFLAVVQVRYQLPDGSSTRVDWFGPEVGIAAYPPDVLYPGSTTLTYLFDSPARMRTPECAPRP